MYIYIYIYDYLCIYILFGVINLGDIHGISHSSMATASELRSLPEAHMLDSHDTSQAAP